MPQGTFVPSHCSSFSPQTKGIILYLNTFHTTIGCFLQTYFHSKVNNRFIVCAPHRFKPLSCAKTLCSDVFYSHWERFNLETFIVFGYIWSCERRGRIKKKKEKKKQRRSRKERLTRHLKRFGEFSEHHGEKSASERGQGHKIQLLDCAVLTLFYVFVLWNMEPLCVLLLFQKLN